MTEPRPGYLQGPMAAWAEQMRTQFELIQRRHRGELGRRREDTFREFLTEFLPKRLAVGTGEIAAADGTVSPQIDVILYDAIDTPLLEQSESSIVVPVEGVYGVIEVSSQLDARKLQEDVEKIRAVKALPKSAYYRQESVILLKTRLYGREFQDFPVLGFCFAYDSIDVTAVRDRLVELDGSDLASNVDMVCSLSKGCVVNGRPETAETGETIYTAWSGVPEPQSERFVIPVDPAEQPGVALMLFYLLAGGPLAQGRTERITMVPYMEIRDRFE